MVVGTEDPTSSVIKGLIVSYSPAVPLVDIYLIEMKTCPYRKTCAPVFTAIFRIAKSRNNPNVHQQMNG